MKWIEEKNKSIDLGDSVKFEVYAEGERLKISTDDNDWIEAADLNGREHRFDIVVKKDGKAGQDFWVKEWGYLKFPSGPVVVKDEIDDDYKAKFLGYHSFVPKNLLDEFRAIYCNFIKGDFRNKDLIKCEFPAFGIVYNDRFIEDFDNGKRARPRVEVWNDNGELELLMDNDSYSTKKGVNDNNHVYYVNIPKGRKRVVIINKENSDFPVLAEIFRQTSEFPSVRYEWGDNDVILPNQRKEYLVDFTYKGLANELFKINCVTRY